MSRILIESKIIEANYRHGYLIFDANDTADDGDDVFRGGPTSGSLSAANILVQQSNIVSSPDVRGTASPEDRGSTVVTTVGAEDKWEIISQLVHQINNADISYTLPIINSPEYVFNSNSVIATALYTVGIDIANYVPSNATMLNLAGAINILNFARDIVGTDHNDTIIGWNQNDNLAGANGNDSISGGAGDDFIYGGDGNDNIDGGVDRDTIFFEGNFGDDEVIGGELIIIDNALLFGEAQYVSADHYTLDSATIVRTSGGLQINEGTNSILLKDWSTSNSYGITLAEEPDEDEDENHGAGGQTGSTSSGGRGNNGGFDSSLGEYAPGAWVRFKVDFEHAVVAGDDATGSEIAAHIREQLSVLAGSDSMQGGVDAGYTHVSQATSSDTAVVSMGNVLEINSRIGSSSIAWNGRALSGEWDTGHTTFTVSQTEYAYANATVTDIVATQGFTPTSTFGEIMVGNYGVGAVPEVTGTDPLIIEQYAYIWIYTPALIHDANGDGVDDGSDLAKLTSAGLDAGDYTVLAPGAGTWKGGAADDTVVVTPGDRTVDGAGGTNHYKFYDPSGTVTLIDALGLGDITIDGATLGGSGATHHVAMMISSTQWNLDGYALTLASGALTIATGAAAEIVIGDFTSGFLGISLGGLEVTGTTGNDTLAGSVGDDTIDGGTGDDTMAGGLSNDIYYVDAAGDVISEDSDEGTDTVISTISYTLGDDLENLTLAGSAALGGTGNSLANLITGNSAANSLSGLGGNDTLDGGAGADTMLGGTGNDTYHVDATGDVVTESSSEGTDTVISTISYTLGANVENLTLDGASAIDATGNALNNTLIGNSAANILSGDDGNDTIDGGAGNDTIDGGTGTDSLLGGEGDDDITVAGSYSYANSGVGDDTVTAYGTHITVDTQGGADTVILDGATYSTFYLGAGDDELSIISTYSIQNVIYAGSGDDNITLTGADNVVFGGLGNDIYHLFNSSDVVIEYSDEGVDTLFTSFTHTLENYTENLTLAEGSAINGTGNAYNNILIGNSSANILSGLAGDDTIDAGAGNDLIKSGFGHDTIDGGDGIDTISYATATAAVFADIGSGNLYLFYGDTTNDELSNIENITGSAYDDSIAGNDDANILIGGSGSDTIFGMDGDDTIDAGADSYDGIDAGEGDDLILSGGWGDYVEGGAGNDTVSYAGALAAIEVSLAAYTANGDTLMHIENLTGTAYDDTISGDGGDNRLEGGAGDDILAGGAGTDTLLGGSGADVFTIADSATATILSDFIHGTDQIDLLDFTDASVFADLTITQDGADAIVTVAHNGTGDLAITLTGVTASTLDADDFILHGILGYIEGTSAGETLTGGSGNDTINGLGGDDTIASGGGHDTIDGGDGIDTVTYAAASSAIFADIGSGNPWLFYGSTTNDTLTHIENITGSDYNDSIAGNSDANMLIGGAGSDTIFGMGGNDTIDAGSDYYDGIDAGDGDDLILSGGWGDYVNGGAGNDTVSYVGASSAIEVSLAAYTTNGDTLVNIENLTGTGYDDTISGNSAANILAGGAGDDLLTGGSGVDTLTGGLGADHFIFSADTDSGLGGGYRDVINDFVDGSDKIDLSGFSGSFTFLGTGNFTGTANEVSYAIASGNTVISIDSNGDGTGDLQIELVGSHTLLGTDFIL